ncbi:MAG: hypothetical protein ACREBS_05865, partial [Nitrososphaerales archaeon]
QDPSAAIPGWDGELIPIPESVARSVAIERGKGETVVDSGMNDVRGWNAEKFARQSVLSEIKAQMNVSTVPTQDRIVIERLKNYLILHTSAGDRVNATLGELFEERLLRMGGMIRHWWTDGYRILIELSTEEYELDELVEKLFHYDDSVSGFLNGVIRKHFPFGYEMKFIAERFGALKRGRMLSGEALKELSVKFRFTPIYDETLREALATKIDIPRSIAILKECSQGSIKLVAQTLEKPSPLSMYIISRHAELEDYAEASINSFDSMKEYAAKEVVSLLCFDCGHLREFVRVGDLPERPGCEECGSRLLSVLFYGARFALNSLLKKKARQPVSKEEMEVLAKARRSADVVLAYGKKGIVAQSVYGIGPQTAARVLSKMHESDLEFYEDLLSAKLKFIETKKYWD